MLPLKPAPTAPRTHPTSPAHTARKAAGLHLVGDLHGCRGNPQLMHEASYLQAFCLRAVAEDAMSEARAAELLNISVRELDRRLMGTLS